MPLHLVKLCVGTSTIEDLQAWVDYRRAERGDSGDHFHRTRMFPKRGAELLDGGSLYWVIKGNIQVRQVITDLRAVRDHDGIAKCDIMLAPRLVPTLWQPRRAFQGWRYLKPADAPRDLASAVAGEAIPAELQLKLAELGLL